MHKDGNLLHAYEYDAHGNRIRMITKDGVTNYQYNKLNQLISKIDSNGNEKYIYDSRGNLSQIDWTNETYICLWCGKPFDRSEKCRWSVCEI